MYILIDDFDFKINKYSCGHETFWNCMNYCFSSALRPEEIYFLSNSQDFNFLNNYTDNLLLGYDSIYNTVEGIRKNITKNITFRKAQNNKIFFEIINQIKSKNIVILAVKENVLFYQKYMESRYPTHIIVIKGFNLEKKVFKIIDLFAKDDFGTFIKEVEIDFEYLLNNTIEAVFMERNHNIIITEYDQNIIINEFYKIINSDGSLDKIRNYFVRLNNISLKARINSIASFKWIILTPLFSFTMQYIENKIDVYFLREIKTYQEKWNILLQKYIKNCYKCNCGNFFDKLKIDELIADTKKLFYQIYILLRDKK